MQVRRYLNCGDEQIAVTAEPGTAARPVPIVQRVVSVPPALSTVLGVHPLRDNCDVVRARRPAAVYQYHLGPIDVCRAARRDRDLAVTHRSSQRAIAALVRRRTRRSSRNDESLAVCGDLRPVAGRRVRVIGVRGQRDKKTRNQSHRCHRSGYPATATLGLCGNRLRGAALRGAGLRGDRATMASRLSSRCVLHWLQVDSCSDSRCAPCVSYYPPGSLTIADEPIRRAGDALQRGPRVSAFRRRHGQVAILNK
jgi:hypothetical protein